MLKAAFHVAQTGRSGPVHVDIAKDVQEAELDFRYPDDVDLPGWKPPVRVHPRQIAAAAEALAAAEKPVLYVGGGTINAEATAELLELAEAGGIPVVTTLMASPIFEWLVGRHQPAPEPEALSDAKPAPVVPS